MFLGIKIISIGKDTAIKGIDYKITKGVINLLTENGQYNIQGFGNEKQNDNQHLNYIEIKKDSNKNY